ncbi:MAG: transglutaminaseTgpA domain-containing protein [Cyanobium sp.]
MALPRPTALRSPRLGAAKAWQWLTLLLLAISLAGLQPTALFGGMAIGLGVLTALKLVEARSLAEHRVVSLLQLVCIGLVAAQRPELAASLLQLAVTLMALAGLLALELGEGLGWRVLLRRSLQVIAAALPLALVLFLLVPRLPPFAAVPLQGGAAAVVGLSEQLDPGGIAELASVDAPAAQVVFDGGAPPPLTQRYWRVLVHERFDGRRWDRFTPPPLVQGDPREVSAAPLREGGVGQLWMAAPSRLQAVPWQGGGRPRGRDLLLDPSGELLHRGPRDQRRVYAIADPADPAPWRSRPPGPADLALPRGSNPRLEALGASWARRPTPEQRLQAARDWFRAQDFRYTLRPGTLPQQAPLDAFLFERRIGFCGHYASSFTALMRAAGVPARVVSGYRGGRWVVPLGGEGYLDLRQSDAHAWSEVWLPQAGWSLIDPTLWIAPEALGEVRRSGWRPAEWLQQQWWGLDILWTRWWLGFDRAGQESWLRSLLGPLLPWLGLVVLVALALALLASLAVLRLLQGRSQTDRLRRQLEALLQLLARQGLMPEPGETLTLFARRAARRRPQLHPQLALFVDLYQRQRYAPPDGARGQAEAMRQLKRLRRQLGRRQRRSRSGAATAGTG